VHPGRQDIQVGRLPVLNRDHRRFAGIISLGDVAVIQDSHYADTAAIE
jgi:CBS domain-containing protein